MLDERTDDKLFLSKEITPSVARLTDKVQEMLSQNNTLREIYEYILKHANNNEQYIVLFLFGMAYQNQNEDIIIHLRK